MDFNFVPEKLSDCKQHYIPPVQKHITCKQFGNCDGMDGSCHWCREMTPYQWEMCRDENWLRMLTSPYSLTRMKSREEAASFIEAYKRATFQGG